MRNWNPFFHARNLSTHRDFSLPMRNWNPSDRNDHILCIYTILACLWGIETTMGWPCALRIIIDFSLPMRNWNQATQFICHIDSGDFSLPMRNWNLKSLSRNYSARQDFSLPMRNWNLRWIFFFLFLFFDFSLPMRNWNQMSNSWNYGRNRILACLWGIETSFF